MVMCGQGCGTLDSIIMTVTRKNFPRDLALAFGLLKTFFGLAAGYMSVVYKALFAPNAADFLLFLGVYSAFAILCFGPFLYAADADGETDPVGAAGVLRAGLKIVVVLIVAVFTISFLHLTSAAAADSALG